MAPCARGLVDGELVNGGEVGLRQRQFDIALAERGHPVAALADQPRRRRKGICWHSISTSASNSRVNPESLPAHGGSTWRTAPSGSRTRGTRTSRKHSCWKKFRCR